MEKLSPLAHSVTLTELLTHSTGAGLQAPFVGYGMLGSNTVDRVQAWILQQLDIKLMASSHCVTWAAKIR